jgi:Protein of unknown function (DUF3761)
LPCWLAAACLIAHGAAAQVPGNAQHYPTAHCSDGTYYYGPRSRKLACAHHRGVAEWLAPPPGARPRGARVTAGRRPRGATARCRDGTWSRSHDRKRACAAHRGVARWLRGRSTGSP